jgi:hypothetical protein
VGKKKKWDYAKDLHYVSGIDAKTVGAMQKTKRPGVSGAFRLRQAGLAAGGRSCNAD